MKSNLTIALFVTSFFSSQSVVGQQPIYTEKKLVNTYDTTEFKILPAPKNGLGRTYLLIQVEIWDTDDNNTTHFRGGGPKLICIEGQFKDGKKNDVFKTYLIDNSDHSKRYKLWEQSYVNDKLNGQWKTFNLKGTLVLLRTFKNDSLSGISRDYWIDGKSIMEEREYFNGESKFILRNYYKSGKIEIEQTVENGVLNGISNEYYENGVLKETMIARNGVSNGPAQRFYENGKIKEKSFLLDGKFDKVRTYYYPNGFPWIVEEYKAGLPWTVIANYDDKGKKRNPGTLKNGYGSLILYNEDGTVRETIMYVNGIKQ